MAIKITAKNKTTTQWDDPMHGNSAYIMTDNGSNIFTVYDEKGKKIKDHKTLISAKAQVKDLNNKFNANKKVSGM